jgi:hypothetical protein
MKVVQTVVKATKKGVHKTLKVAHKAVDATKKFMKKNR